MEQYDDRFPKRKNPRLRNYDYCSPGYYFITICTRDKACIFGSPDRLNCYGKYAAEGLREIERHFPGIRIDKYVVMPNHIHCIIVLSGGTKLSVVIGQYKSFVTRKARTCTADIEIWQPSFHDHIIRNQLDYERIWAYIDANPARWQDDCFYAESLPCI